jgi:hypothetical protein
MKRLAKIAAMIMMLAAILVLTVTGTVLAASGQSGNGNHGDECPYGDCVNGDCEPNDYCYNHSYEYNSPGPHGPNKMESNSQQVAAGDGSQYCFQKGR